MFSRFSVGCYNRTVQIQAILFDLGRVILDFDMADCESTLASNSDLDQEEFLRVLWDTGRIRQYECGKLTTSEFYEYLCREGGLRMDYDDFYRSWSDVFRPEPILSAPFLTELANRYTMVLISNTNEAHADYIRRHYDVFDCFEHHILSYQVGALKPDPKIFEAAIEVTGHHPAAVLFIDDREENVAAGAELGMQTHRFESVAGLHRLFNDLGVDFSAPGEDIPETQ